MKDGNKSAKDAGTKTPSAKSPKSGHPQSGPGSVENGFPALQDAEGLIEAHKAVHGSPKAKWDRHISREKVKEFFKFMNYCEVRERSSGKNKKRAVEGEQVDDQVESSPAESLQKGRRAREALGA